MVLRSARGEGTDLDALPIVSPKDLKYPFPHTQHAAECHKQMYSGEKHDFQTFPFEGYSYRKLWRIGKIKIQ
jgi:hypothetical protein